MEIGDDVLRFRFAVRIAVLGLQAEAQVRRVRRR
jgi:hypothetical protein